MSKVRVPRLEKLPIDRKKLLSRLADCGVSTAIFGKLVHRSNQNVKNQLYNDFIMYEWAVIFELKWGIKYEEYARDKNVYIKYEKVIRPKINRTKLTREFQKRNLSHADVAEQMGLSQDSLRTYIGRGALPEKWIKWLAYNLKIPYTVYEG